MNLDFSTHSLNLQKRLLVFMGEHILPNEQALQAQLQANRASGDPFARVPLIEELKGIAQKQGLWNLFLPRSPRAPEGLSNLDYAPLCEIMGRVPWCAEVFNCSAPDTGNMEVFERYANEDLKRQWLDPLLRGEIRSAFAMTEPAVASSDATNISLRIERDGDFYVLNGRKWWISNAGTCCAVYIVMGRSDPDAPRHAQQSMIIVPKDSPGVKTVRNLTVFGYDDAPHGHFEIDFENVRVPASNMLLGQGRGFEIAQGRLGPGRIHHCMRSIGVAERALELMCARLQSRVAFGKVLSTHSVWHERIANARCMIDQARLLTLRAAYMMDTVGNKVAKAEISMIKVVAPNMASQVVDWAIQAHGGGGLSDDFPLAWLYEKANADVSVKAIVITGAGKAFSGGADIKELGSPRATAEPNLGSVILALEGSIKPVVAAMHSVAMGGGLELALGCHYRIAAPGTSIALPEVKLGLIPGAGGSMRLPRVVGVETALNMIVSGEPVASELLAQQAGQKLFDKMAASPQTLPEEALAFARSVAADHAKSGAALPLVRNLPSKHPMGDAYFQFARNMVKGVAKNMPAPLKCVDVVEASTQKKFDEGMALEREIFTNLMFTPESRALRHLFVAERAASKIPDVPEDTPKREIKSVAVIGAGTMGGASL